MKIKRGNWKAAKINPVALQSHKFENLLGFEELHEYNVIDRESKATRLSTKKKKLLTKKDCPTRTIDHNKSTDTCPENITSTAWLNFGIHESLLKGLEANGFTEPTPIQAITLPPAILGRRDILGAAETGSGKTLAFGLPILTGILQAQENKDDTESDQDEPTPVTKSSPLYAIILTPTRELALQVRDHLIAVTKFTKIRIAVLVGGMAAVKQERLLSYSPEIVIATPGRLWELLEEGNAHLAQIDGIKYLAIDETDRMLESGHFQELHQLLERLNMDPIQRDRRQKFVFSATLTLVHEPPKHLLMRKRLQNKSKLQITPRDKLRKLIETLGIKNPKVVDITEDAMGVSSTLTECRICCEITEKDYYLYYFLQRHIGRTIIFCNSIGCVRRLTTILSILGCSVMSLHSAMQQRQRLNSLDKFRVCESGILIATDVAARGLDIMKVAHVIHYQTPRTAEIYVHRSGRTARNSCAGLSLLLVEPAEQFMYARLNRTLNRTVDIPLFPIDNKLLNAVKERVNCARQLDKLELTVKKTNSEVGWLQKAAEEMDIIIDNDSSKHEMQNSRAHQKAADVKRKQLAVLLGKPLFPNRAMSKFPVLHDVMQTIEEPKTALGVISENTRVAKKVLKLKRVATEIDADVPVPKSSKRSKRRTRKLVNIDKK